MAAGPAAAPSSKAMPAMAGSITTSPAPRVIDDIAGETDGTAVTAGGQAGYLFDLGGVRVGPVVGVRYAKVELDAVHRDRRSGADPQRRGAGGRQPGRQRRRRAARRFRLGRARGPALSPRPRSSASSPATPAPSATRSPRRRASSTSGCCPDSDDDVYGRVDGRRGPSSFTGALSLQLNGSTTIGNERRRGRRRLARAEASAVARRFVPAGGRSPPAPPARRASARGRRGGP